MTRSLFKAETLAADFVPYSAQVTSDILSTYEGCLCSVLHIDGIAFDTADVDYINGRHEALNLALRNIADPHVAIWVNLIRSERAGYPEGVFQPGFAAALDANYAQSLAAKKMRVNDIYLTLIYRPVANPAERLVRMLAGAARERAAQRAAAIERLTEIRDNLVAALLPWGAGVLGTYRDGPVTCSGPLEALSLIANGYHQRYPLTASPLDAALMTARVSFGAEILEIRAPHMRRFGAILNIKEYPAATQPEVLNALLSAPFDFQMAQSFKFEAKTAAMERFRRQQVRLINTGDRALSQIDEISWAMDDLASNRFVAGEHHLSLLILADSRDELGKIIPQARAYLADAGMVVAREDMGLEAAYWSQLPANFRYRLRPSLITSRNFAAFANHHNFPTGQADGNHWGPALTLLKTKSGAPYYFSFHVADIGNTIITGPTGSGKTVFQGFMLAQLQKFNTRTIFFDKDRGADILIRALGGRYLPLQMGRSTGLAPFKALEPTPANLLFLGQLVQKLAASGSGQPLTPREDKMLQEAVRSVMSLSHENRSLSAILTFLDSTDQAGLAQRLHKWCRATGGQFAWALDNETDELRFDRMLIGFDVTEFLDFDTIRTPLVMYLFQRIDALINGERLSIFMDEFWKLLEDDYFQDFAQNKLKTIRKQNGFLVAGTQSPRDTLNSKIAHTIVEQSPTQIFMPNPRARESDYIEGFKVTRREYELIKTELVDTRHFLLKQGNQSVVATLDLAGMDDALAVLSGTTANVGLVSEIVAEVGEDPADWLPLFWARRK